MPGFFDPRTPLLPKPHRRGLQLAVAAQVAFLLLVAVAGYAVGHFGRTIALRTMPVDPRDLLYGDYVVLNFTISQLDVKQWRGAQPPRVHQPVYVELRPTPDGSYAAVAIYPENPPHIPASHAVLRGWVQSNWRTALRIRYGLERYYVPEGTGARLERRTGSRPLLVRVNIAPWGQSRITEVAER
ncbi:GDYXXLXY domain-containing protein [Hymenobacter busanensis]|uniref:GDYXXLXY domain-containing protein n=1 Tax=Hymenobacter busanensis TaxID=2607656 RepID=A0A7L4ZZ58_9BACT|nr:GDYXXLXY domain-containing protein [Hymenobacter busanensis]KAA9333187.1 GDYXXLXY domain-containing protein [Hymenobacter busanensis]QHJ08136.1 hypothetical protein GUY19_12910 [Hymenobacter busanensis]